MTNDKFKILSLDGGGVRGYLSVGLLENIEKYFNEKEGNMQAIGMRFDLIVGTSTGSIIAALLAKGMFAKDIKEIYLSSMKKVFKKRNIFTRHFQSTYNPIELKTIVFNELKEQYNKKQLVFNDLERDLLITSFDLEEFRPKIFKSNYSRKNTIDYNVSDAVMASTAAPSYFPAYCDMNGKGVFIDGGVSANNPSLLALIDSMHFERESKRGTSCPQNLSSVSLLSIGTGKYRKKLDLRALRNGHKLDWAINLIKKNSPIKDVLFSAQEELEESKVRLLAEVNEISYIRINPELDELIELDDVLKMSILEEYTSIDKYINDLEKMLVGEVQ